MTAPLVSIITPCFHARRYLPATWHSVRAQTMRDWEWLVADDGSTDGSLEWLRELAQRDERVRLIPGKPSGQPGATRNRSIAAMRGEFAAFLDADDLWHREKLAHQLDLMQAQPEVDLTYCWAEEFWSSESRTDSPPQRVWKRVELRGNALPALLSSGNLMCTSGILFRRTLLERVGLFSEDPSLRVYEDYEWNLRAASKAIVARTPGLLVSYRLHRDNISRAFSPNSSLVLIESARRHDLLHGAPGRRFLSNQHLRIAEGLLADVEGPSPRPHLLRAAVLSPLDPRRWLSLAVALLPRGRMLTAYTRLKRLQTRLFAASSAPHRFGGGAWTNSEAEQLPSGLDAIPARPFVSIIVPAYNEESRIANCLDAILALEWPRHRREIIVVDNGSTDATREAVARYAERGVQLLVEDNVRSSYACRNLGAANAKGELLAFTDADARVDPRWLREAVRAMRRCDAPFVGSRVILEPSNHPANTADTYEMLTAFDVERAIRVHRYTPTVTLLVTRALFSQLAGFDATLYSGGDADFGRRAHRSGARQTYAASSIVRHHTRGSTKALIRKVRRTDYNAMKLARYKAREHLDARRVFFFFRNMLPPNPFFLPRRARALGLPLSTAQAIATYLLHYRMQLASTAAGIAALLDGRRETAVSNTSKPGGRFTDA